MIVMASKPNLQIIGCCQAQLKMTEGAQITKPQDIEKNRT